MSDPTNYASWPVGVVQHALGSLRFMVMVETEYGAIPGATAKKFMQTICNSPDAEHILERIHQREPFCVGDFTRTCLRLPRIAAWVERSLQFSALKVDLWVAALESGSGGERLLKVMCPLTSAEAANVLAEAVVALESWTNCVEKKAPTTSNAFQTRERRVKALGWFVSDIASATISAAERANLHDKMAYQSSRPEIIHALGPLQPKGGSERPAKRASASD